MQFYFFNSNKYYIYFHSLDTTMDKYGMRSKTLMTASNQWTIIAISNRDWYCTNHAMSPQTDRLILIGPILPITTSGVSTQCTIRHPLVIEPLVVYLSILIYGVTNNPTWTNCKYTNKATMFMYCNFYVRFRNGNFKEKSNGQILT